MVEQMRKAGWTVCRPEPTTTEAITEKPPTDPRNEALILALLDEDMPELTDVQAARVLRRIDARQPDLNAVIDYAIEQGYEGINWILAWREGDPTAVADLAAWRAAIDVRLSPEQQRVMDTHWRLVAEKIGR
jgi:hypothetical protein